MPDSRNQTSNGARNLNMDEEREGVSGSRLTPVWSFLVLLAAVACCGLPVLIVIAGGFASISVVAGRYELFTAGAAVSTAIVAVTGIALRVRKRSKSPQVEPVGDNGDGSK